MSNLKACKSCSNEVATSAKTCPNCGQKLKMGFLKKVAIGIFGFLVLGALSSRDEREESSRPESSETVSSPAQETSSSTTHDGQIGIGDEFTLGDYRYKVSRTSDRSSVGGKFFKETASSGATFFIVNYTIENLTNESQTVMSDDFVLIDSKGRKFKPSSNANTALMTEDDDKDFILSELQPGIPRNMASVFEIPNGVLSGSLTLEIPKKGFFSSGKELVKVR